MKILKNILPLLLLLLLTQCNFKNGVSPVTTGDNRIPHNPIPTDGSVDLPVALTLKWQASGVNLFDVYFDRVTPPVKIYAKNVDTSRAVVVTGLKYSTTYYWRVVSKLADGSLIKGDIWKFTTKPKTNNLPGYVLIEKKFYTELPHIVNILFSTLDLNGVGVDALTTGDFDLLEDGQPLPLNESKMEILKKSRVPYEYRTVLMLDNSTSLINDLSNLKISAIDFVSHIAPGEKIAIYVFSDNVSLIQDFTGDVALLKAAINSITIGYSTTNLYGAVIIGASRLLNIYETDNIVQSSLVIFTDGTDTQGSHTLSDALDAVNNKSVYTVGLGSDINPEILGMLGTSGFYPIANIGDLKNVFLEIQTKLEKLSNSFYWLRYQTPKRGQAEHTVTLSIKNNANKGEYSTIIEKFNSAGFFSIAAGLYFNSTSSNPNGIDTLNLFAGGKGIIVKASSYLASNLSSFSWSVPDTTLVTLKTLNSINSEVEIKPKNKRGTTSTLVKDLNNKGYSKELFIKIN